MGLLGVDQAHGRQARVAGDGVAGDHPAAVVPDDRHLVQFEEVDDAPDALDVLIDRERRVGREPAGASARQIDHMAGDVIDQMRQEPAERGPADGPAVDEQHVGAGSDAAVGDLAGADVEEPVGRGTEQFGGSGRGEHRHRISVRRIGAARCVEPLGACNLALGSTTRNDLKR